MRFRNGSNKVVIELRVVQFWSEIILVISNRTRAARSFNFEITRMISDQIALYSVQLPLLIIRITISSIVIGLKNGLFFTNSLANLLSDSLLLDSLLSDSLVSQSHSKL